MLACNLSQRNYLPYCRNKFSATEDDAPANSSRESSRPNVNGELDDDIIVISDDEQPSCSKKLCKTNPNCLNYLGQEKWEDEGRWFIIESTSFFLWLKTIDEAEQAFFKAAKLGENPSYESRESDLPVGLKVNFAYNSFLFTYHGSSSQQRTLELHAMQMLPYK